MNPQYAPPQQFGMPPQPFAVNRASPALGPPPTTQGFQNIPLGPQKPGPPQQPPGPVSFPVSSSPNNPPGNAGPPPGLRTQVPASQLPPSLSQEQRPPGFAPNQFGPPPTSKPGGPPGVQNGPPQFMNGPPQFTNAPQFQNGPPHVQNGPGFGPPPTSTAPPQSQLPPNAVNKPPGAPPQGPNEPPQSNQPQPPRPGQPPLPTQSPFGPPPPSNQPPSTNQPPSSNQHSLNQPPSSNQAPFNQPPSGNQPPFNQPPSSNQPPFNQPPSSNQPPFNQPPSSNQPPFNPPSSNQPPFNQPPSSNQTSFNQALSSNQPPSGTQPPFNQPPSGFQPPKQPSSNQPPSGAQPPFNQPPFNQPHPGQPPLSGPPPSQPGPPLPGNHPPPSQGQPPLPGQPQFPPGQRPNQFGHGAGVPIGRPYNQPPLSGPNQPPLLGPGQPPMSGPSHPPMPGGKPPLPGHSQPPLPGQPPLGPNQLANQMQGMNLGPGRQYPGSAMNGDGGPHMPPPLSQQQYMNGQQVRGPPGPGYPPMPGQQPAPGGGLGSYPQPGYQQPQQARRLDPDQMPSPIQVTQDDQQNRSGIFCTNQKGLVPPLVTTNFIVQDQGNASPRFIRSSMYNVPVSQDIMKQTAVPFSLVISPMARTVDQEYPPPIVNFGDLGPVRCIRCKAYMCPFMQFIDSGRRFQCLFCKATTDVPAEYFQHLDHTGQRLDRYERPELVLGTYEFVATPEYCRNNTLPKPPAVVFVIDVSYNNVKSGLVHLLCSKIKDIIQHLPVDQGQEKSNMRVGFITYNSSVHFYNIKGNLAAPQMLIVGDIQEMFMPLLDGFLCTPEESGPVIDSLMQQIPAMFGETRETETILLPAILAGLEALKASDCAGKLMVFHSSLPTAEGPGKLKNRDDRKLLGTEKERTILTPQTQAYNQLGQDCVGAGCSVDLFVFNNSYIDIATIGQVSRLTGGEVHKYTYFQADIDGERLIKDIVTNISRPIAFDAIMRVRTSTGVRPTDFYGHFFMSNTTDMELAAIDCDKAVAVEIKHDDKLSEEEGVYIQAALLYTSVSGQRRLRIINLSLKTCSQMADLYRNCDCDTIINYVSKQSTYKLFEHNPKAVKDNIVTRAAQILATYRKNCASPSSAGQLILPECMKLLPLYVNCLLKSDALSGGSDMTVDDRSYVMQEVMIMDIPTSVNYFYPRLIPLIDLDPTQDPVEIPAPIRCTVDKMNEQGVYILENGIHMFLWIGLGANPNFIQQVFGVPSAIQVDIDRTTLPELDNPLSLAVRTIIEEIRVQRHKCMRLTLVRQREKLEPVFKHFLAEDRGTDGSPSYVDFLIHMHKEIRALLS